MAATMLLRDRSREAKERRNIGRQPAEATQWLELKAELHRRVLDEMAVHPNLSRSEMRERVLYIIDTEIALKRPKLRRGEELKVLIESLLNDIFGLGAIQHLVDDPDVSEIMVNGPDQVYVERAGRVYATDVKFDSTEQLKTVIERIVGLVGRRVDESFPMVDARLPDGSRVNVVMEPVVLDGPHMTIRKFRLKLLSVEELVDINSATANMMTFLTAAVKGRQNILITGGSSSGKTTLLNVLSGFIGDQERIVTIEDAVELRLRQKHVVRMETRPPNTEGKGMIAVRDLVRNSLRMRPDRIVVGEVRGPEALDMIQAMNTDHDGGMSTLHANSSQDALQRLETMAMMAGVELPSAAMRFQICSAINLVVHTERVSGGARKIVEISEVLRVPGEMQVQPIFWYEQTGVDAEENATGVHRASGTVPDCVERIRARGLEVDERIFARGAGLKKKPAPKKKP
jgi:pilus assembly protein CpaF